MLSNKAKYGLQALIYLAEAEHGRAASPQRAGERGVAAAEIAAHENISKKFLDAILNEMKNHGLLRAKKGKGGGFFLARPPSEIAVGHVLRALDGPLAPVACVSRTAYQPCANCQDEASCRIRMVMQDVREAIAGILDNTSLADMVARGREPLANMFYI